MSFILTRQLSSYWNAVNSWTATQASVAAAAGVASPNGKHNVFKVTVNSTGDPKIAETITFNPQNFNFKMGVWLWTDSGQPFSTVGLYVTGNGETRSGVDSISNTPKLCQFTTGSSFANSSSTMGLRIDADSGSWIAGNYFYVFVPHIGLSEGYLLLTPEWDFSVDDQKIESRHRARAGREYVYKWGKYDSMKFGLTFVNSAQRTIINDSYWGANERVICASTPGNILMEGRLVGPKLPIGKFQKPYMNQWTGVIDLDGF